jgi:hypothetical protein
MGLPLYMTCWFFLAAFNVHHFFFILNIVIICFGVLLCLSVCCSNNLLFLGYYFFLKFKKAFVIILLNMFSMSLILPLSLSMPIYRFGILMVPQRSCMFHLYFLIIFFIIVWIC